MKTALIALTAILSAAFVSRVGVELTISDLRLDGHSCAEIELDDGIYMESTATVEADFMQEVPRFRAVFVLNSEPSPFGAVIVYDGVFEGTGHLSPGHEIPPELAEADSVFGGVRIIPEPGVADWDTTNNSAMSRCSLVP